MGRHPRTSICAHQWSIVHIDLLTVSQFKNESDELIMAIIVPEPCDTDLADGREGL